MGQTDEVLSNVGKTIIEVTERYRKRANGPSPDALKALSALINAYRKLHKRPTRPMDEEPGPTGIYPRGKPGHAEAINK